MTENHTREKIINEQAGLDNKRVPRVSARDARFWPRITVDSKHSLGGKYVPRDVNVWTDSKGNTIPGGDHANEVKW